MTRTIINKANYQDNVSVRGEINDQPSETVPNEARTIQEILEMYKAGQRPDQKNFEFLDVEDLEKINRYYRNPRALDYTDLEELSLKNQSRIAELQRLQDNIDKEKQDIITDNPDTDKDGDGKIDEET